MTTFTRRNLFIKRVTDDDHVQAIRGQKIPQALASQTTRRCVIRGIRYHPDFGIELRGLLPEFTRALNARSIMSNQIPEMDPEHPEEFPYCIWHPETASEATYRELAQRYPHMKYLVGRACAVAGYVDLFYELNLLPECHIAEEARESGHMAICDAIMKADVKYNAMDDYAREIFTPAPGHLNGDTIIRSYLDIRFSFKGHWPDAYYGIHWAMFPSSFDLTEDDRVDEKDVPSEPPEPPFSIKPPFLIKDEEILPLLYRPLQTDLPTLHKDLLILAAAFYGDIDRYTRLRRPVAVMSEFRCLVRGIYNKTIFAKWCSLQTDERFQCAPIKAAINARFIMNGDLSRITAHTPDAELPYCIWYPATRMSVLKELLRRQPKMKDTIARACILADYEQTYDLLDTDPDTVLMQDARDSPNPHYLQDLEAKIPKRGCKDLQLKSRYQVSRRKDMFEKPVFSLGRGLADQPPGEDHDGLSYNSWIANFGHLNLSLSVPESLREHIPEIGELDIDDYYDSFACNPDQRVSRSKGNEVSISSTIRPGTSGP